MKKFALFAFNGDPMCFVHVLLNALDLKEKGHEVALVIEGSAVKLVTLLTDGTGLEEFRKNSLHMYDMLAGLFADVKNAELIDCVCQACSKQLGVLDAVRAAGLPLASDMSGHPSMSRYIDTGYSIITF